MHNAPAVSYPVGRSRFHIYLLAAFVLMGGLSLLAWGEQASVAVAWQLIAWSFWLLASFVATVLWWRTPAGALNWDASGWTWTAQSPPMQTGPLALRAVLDLQGVLLLLAQPTGMERVPLAPRWWFWAERHRAPLRWQALRRAVFAPQHPTAAFTDADGAGS